MAKYDKNGDGQFDQSEVEGIIDDYMGTIYNKQSLEDANKTQRKIIIFSTILIVLLSLSNLGTGIAPAAYILSKDITVIDGRLMPAMDGDESAMKDGQALMTTNSVRRFDAQDLETDSFRRLQDLTVETTVACIDIKTATAVGQTVAKSGGASLGLVRDNIAGGLTEASTDLTSLISLYGSMVYSEDGLLLTFPASNITKIDMTPTSECMVEQGKFSVVLIPSDACTV